MFFISTPRFEQNVGRSSAISSAFLLESGNGTDHGSYGRWAVAFDVDGTDNNVSADEYMVTTKLDTSDPSTSPTWGGINNGLGNMWVNESTGDIFIYS